MYQKYTQSDIVTVIMTIWWGWIGCGKKQGKQIVTQMVVGAKSAEKLKIRNMDQMEEDIIMLENHSGK